MTELIEPMPIVRTQAVFIFFTQLFHCCFSIAFLYRVTTERGSLLMETYQYDKVIL